MEDPSGADYDTINVDWESVNNKTTALKKSDDSVTGMKLYRKIFL